MIIFLKMILEFFNIENQLLTLFCIIPYFVNYVVDLILAKMHKIQQIRLARAEAELKELELAEHKKDHDVM